MKGFITLKLGGVNRSIKFGNRALLDVLAKHNFSSGIEFTFDLVCDLVYFGLLNNCMINKINPDFTEEDVKIWCDDISNDEVMSVFNTFTASYTGVDTSEETKKTTATKKK